MRPGTRSLPNRWVVVAVVAALAVAGGFWVGIRMKVDPSAGTRLVGAEAEPSADASAEPSAPPPADPSTEPSAPAEEEQPARGPVAADYVDIADVPVAARGPRPGRSASRGSFVSRCGRNTGGHRNPDNYIASPGVTNGAHHMHDYVGNLSTDAFSTDASLAAAGTTCALGDRSTYFWPVLRRTQAGNPGDDPDLNNGEILTPGAVTLRFRGNPTSRVVAMPRFLRVITGNARAATGGGVNARAQWTCSGFTNRITTQYPLCPGGSRLIRILDFPSCWDGQNLDSANHRTHVVFPDAATGACPAGTRAVPQLRMTLRYEVGAVPETFALDSFPEQLHSPLTDHGDFENLFPRRVMDLMVRCVNRGRDC